MPISPEDLADLENAGKGAMTGLSKDDLADLDNAGKGELDPVKRKAVAQNLGSQTIDSQIDNLAELDARLQAAAELGQAQAIAKAPIVDPLANPWDKPFTPTELNASQQNPGTHRTIF